MRISYYVLIIQKLQKHIFMNNKIKAVIFDMDGVLIDAKDWHYEALNKALRLFGIEISRYDHLVTFDGLPTKDKLNMLTLEKKLPIGIHSFLNEMKQIYTMEIVHSCCKPTFYHQFALSSLKKENYKRAMLGGSSLVIETGMTRFEELGVPVGLYLEERQITMENNNNKRETKNEIIGDTLFEKLLGMTSNVKEKTNSSSRKLTHLIKHKKTKKIVHH